MRIFYMANNLVGWRLAQWLLAEGVEFAGAALHPPARARYRDEIQHTLELAPEQLFDASQLHAPETLARLRDLQPDLGLSIYFGTILRPELLELFPSGVVNLHPSFLPYNRGANPNVWSIIDGTPAGVTLHTIDNGIDTGDIIAQEQVCVEAVDTGATLYRKLEQAAIGLFQRAWPQLAAGAASRMPQPPGFGPARRVRDLAALDEIDLDRRYTGRELIDLLRARTFPPYPGAYFRAADGGKIYLRLELLPEAEFENSAYGAKLEQNMAEPAQPGRRTRQANAASGAKHEQY
jgi:methionyl-tRNA formyltransferase